MEVVVTEEKKKIFRARKTMKISDRQQLESLHSTLLTAAPGLSDTSSPPLMNGTHKADGPNVGDKEQSNISDSNSSCATSPASPTSLSSPAPFLSLNLSPSSASSQSPKSKEQTSPTSPFHSLNFELKKMQEVGEEGSSSNQSVTQASTESKETQEKDMEVNPAMEKKEAEQTTTKDPAMDLDSSNGLAPCSSVPPPPPVSDCTEPMDTDNDNKTAKDPEASTAKIKDGKPSSPKSTTSDSSLSCPSLSHPVPSSCVDPKQEKQIKEEVQSEKENVKMGPINEAKLAVDSVKAEIKTEKTGVSQTTKQCRPSSTPPSDTVEEGKGSTPGLKRTLSEGCEKEEQAVKRDGKRPKVERGELEAQLELKITAKAGSHHKLEKIVQQLVDERLRALQVTIFDKHFKELKDRVDEIDCATKHQTAINTLQVKIARLAKKFGEANQASENKRKQEQALAAAAAASATATAKTATVSSNPTVQRPVWTSMEVKQTPTVSSSSAVAQPAPPVRSAPPPAPSLPAVTAPPVLPTTSTSMVTQAPILQLITSNSNAVTTLATSITTQSPTGTLLLKTAPGSSMMTAGQPLLIQLPLSMANGQAGTLVNIPVSSFSTTNSLNKAKTTSATTTFILKPAPANTAAQASAPATATIPALQMSTGQMSVARAVYHGGAGAITTPNAGVSMTTARTPAQSVSVAGAMSSVSSPAASGPAATGSTAPGPPQGTSLTSKTESDQSGEEPSEEQSFISSFDSEEEEMFLEQGDIVLDKSSSNEEWEPETSNTCKRPHGAVQKSSSEESEDEPHPSTSQRGSSGRRSRRRARTRASSKTSSSSGLPEERWFGISDPDIIPAQPTFRPAHTPGPNLIHTASYTVLQLFQLYFTNSVIQTIVTNSNEYGRAHLTRPSNPWTDITLQDMFSFMSLVIYMGVLKCSTFTDYWRGGKLYNLPFARTVMSSKKFIHINRSIHMSSSEDDAANDQRRGTAKYDRLCKIKPLYEEMRDACKRNYHPAQEIAVDERMVATKACIGLKLFALVDSKTGYTWDFFVYDGKQSSSGKGPSYESVMELVNTRLLGTGYKLFVDNFHTSPALFCDLLQQRIWACGAIRTSRVGYPKTKVNRLDSRSPPGSIRWIRKDSLLFVQWKETRDVFMCSTLHTAHGQETVRSLVKGDDGQWTRKYILVPPAVKEYNQWMGGVDISDALINYYKVLHKTRKWYKTFFYQFMDIAIVNAFILHKELAKGKGEKPLTQKAFQETLAEQLAEVGSATPAPSATPVPSASVTSHHRPVHISGNSTKGRLKCRKCHAKTPVKCVNCDIPLCFVPTRDCYNTWHAAHGL